MLVQVLKSFFKKITSQFVELFVLNLIFVFAYASLFILFGFFRFSALFANVLKGLHLFLLYFFTIPMLVFLSEENKKTASIKQFILKLQLCKKKAFIFASFMLLLNLGAILLIRCKTIQNTPVLLSFVVFLLLVLFLSLAFLLPEITKSIIEKNSRVSFFSSCRKSIILFLENPLISLILFLVQIILRLMSLFSFFLIPSWILGDLIFFIADNSISLQKK